MTATFTSVWYLPDENRWRDMQLMAMRDKGTLVVSDRGAEFTGSRGRVVITDVKLVSFGKQGRDYVNNWVRIDYADDRTAFFADGSGLGWGGILGGTRRILDAMLPLQDLGPIERSSSARWDSRPQATVASAGRTSSPWSPTHMIPYGGLEAWDDQFQQAIGRIAGYEYVVLEDHVGEFALVRTFDRSKRWVTYKGLVAVAGPPVAPERHDSPQEPSQWADKPTTRPILPRARLTGLRCAPIAPNG